MPEKILAGNIFVISDKVKKIANPYTKDTVGEVYLSDSSHFEKSAAYLEEAFKRYRISPVYTRQEILSKISESISAQKESLAKLITDETGKPIKFSRIEIERAILTFRLGAEECSRIHGDVLDLSLLKGSENKTGIVRKFPIGTILGITPWNFPINLVAHKISPALASGNAIMIKPSSNSMLTALALGRIIFNVYAELYRGVPLVNILTLSGSDMDKHLSDSRIKMVSFTGSSDIGWGIKSKAVKQKVSLELGGNAGVIVCEDADIKSAVQKIVIGGFAAAGQSCISVQRIYIHAKVYDDFRAELIEQTKKVKFGNPYEDDTLVGPMITEDEARRAESWIKAAKESGAEILTGGNRNSAVLEPTIIEAAPDSANVKCNEVFAPVITIDKFTSFEEAVNSINNSRFGLQAGVFTNDFKKINYAYNNIQTGGVIINDASAYRMDSMPYGGVKDSGNAREGVAYAIKEMTEEKILVY